MLESLLEKTAAALENAAIPYMIIGGQAVLVYGEPRLTKDIDITLGVGLDRLAATPRVSQTHRFLALIAVCRMANSARTRISIEEAAVLLRQA